MDINKKHCIWIIVVVFSCSSIVAYQCYGKNPLRRLIETSCRNSKEEAKLFLELRNTKKLHSIEFFDKQGREFSLNADVNLIDSISIKLKGEEDWTKRKIIDAKNVFILLGE